MIENKWYSFMFNENTGDDYVAPVFIMLFIVGFILGAVVSL